LSGNTWEIAEFIKKTAFYDNECDIQKVILKETFQKQDFDEDDGDLV
jgi:hypothetical protein